MENKRLPMGTVLLLKESTKRIMVTGYYQRTRDSDKLWDYAGCLFPEGFVAADKIFLFDDEQIEKVYAYGYQDQEFFAFSDEVKKLVNE